jgi:hypothetical protein
VPHPLAASGDQRRRAGRLHLSPSAGAICTVPLAPCWLVTLLAAIMLACGFADLDRSTSARRRNRPYIG